MNDNDAGRWRGSMSVELLDDDDNEESLWDAEEIAAAGAQDTPDATTEHGQPSS